MKCNNCGKEMNNDNGIGKVGMIIPAKTDHPEDVRFRQRYGVDELRLCLCCLAQALGMRRSTYTEGS